MKTLYHGSDHKIEEISNQIGMFFSENINDAQEFAGENGFLYKIEIDTTNMIIEEDFDYFDCARINFKNNEITFNPKSGWYFIKNFNLISINK